MENKRYIDIYIYRLCSLRIAYMANVYSLEAHRYYWDPFCTFGMLGCFADGENVECRYCGEGDFQAKRLWL